jgi:hypothetical protein
VPIQFDIASKSKVKQAETGSVTTSNLRTSEARIRSVGRPGVSPTGKPHPERSVPSLGVVSGAREQTIGYMQLRQLGTSRLPRRFRIAHVGESGRRGACARGLPARNPNVLSSDEPHRG